MSSPEHNVPTESVLESGPLDSDWSALAVRLLHLYTNERKGREMKGSRKVTL